MKDNGIHFVIRMRLGDYEAEVSASGGKAYYKMYLKCAVKDKLIKKRVWLERQAYTIVTMPNPKALAEKPVPIFLTTLPDAKKAAEPYVKRWKIECLFKHLKTNGYNIEDINLKDQGKSLLMFAIAATAYILAFGEGHKRQKDIPTHRYADGAESPEVSIFREGLAWITPKCYRFVEFLKYLFKAMKPEYHPILQNVQ